MKTLILAAAILGFAIAAQAQSDGFKKENLFTGGNVQASFSSGGTVLGLSPTLGYSLNKYLDAGIMINFTYTGYTIYTGDKYREYDYGPGVFARVYPINFLFLQGNFEHNFVSQNLKSGSGLPNENSQLQANSLLIGGGYCSGRQDASTPFFYLSIMVDLLRDPNSPYYQPLQNGSLQALPVIKAGFQIPLFQGNSGRRSRN